VKILVDRALTRKLHKQTTYSHKAVAVTASTIYTRELYVVFCATMNKQFYVYVATSSYTMAKQKTSQQDRLVWLSAARTMLDDSLQSGDVAPCAFSNS